MNQAEVSTALQEIADRLKADGEKNFFRINAYKRGAATVTSLSDFEKLTVDQLSMIKGIGSALSDKIVALRDGRIPQLLADLRARTELAKRWPHAEAMAIAEGLADQLRKRFPDTIVTICGSLRRGKDPKDIDIVLAGEGDGYNKFFQQMTPVGIKADLWTVPKESVGAAVLFATGSADFNIKLRGTAKRRGWKLTRYALEEADTGKVIARATEEEIFKALGMEYVEPTKRN